MELKVYFLGIFGVRDSHEAGAFEYKESALFYKK
jgi:hypothetical protein